MLSREELRRQINLRIFGSPATLVPLLGGGAALVSPLLFSIAPAVPVFIGISGLVAAGGNVLIQSLLSRDKIIREILAEADTRDQEARKSTLDGLYFLPGTAEGALAFRATAVGEATTGTADADVTFDTAGDFAYFCTAHPSSMTGVVYVVDP